MVVSCYILNITELLIATEFINFFGNKYVTIAYFVAKIAKIAVKKAQCKERKGKLDCKMITIRRIYHVH